MKPHLLVIQALSPLHAGTGQSTGAVDLALAREKATGFPYLPGSGLKGALRDRCEQMEQTRQSTRVVFGPEQKDAGEHAGALIVGDGLLLLLPVRSLHGTFAYVTSPYLIRRLLRDWREVSRSTKLPEVPVIAQMERCLTAEPSLLKPVTGKPRVVLEDLDFACEAMKPALGELLGKLVYPEERDRTERETLVQRLCILHDDVMAYLAQQGTDVVARIALDPETKTVKTGALWYEENLPTETILYSLVTAMAPRGSQHPGGNGVGETLRQLVQLPLQLGGNATIGCGRSQLVLSGGEP